MCFAERWKLEHSDGNLNLNFPFEVFIFFPEEY